MSAAIDIDVLVVGLGPADASAAAMAAAAGCSVVALERNAKPGLPVQCAEFVPVMIGQEVTEMVPVRHQVIDKMITYVEGEPADIKPEFPGHMIDRAKFDQTLVAQAVEAGADCRFATPVKTIDDDGLVTTVRGEKFRPRVIIGADGPRSVVAAAIGASNRELVETRQITVPLLKPHSATDIFLSAKIPGGYGWLFPKGDVANLGLGVTPEFKSQLKPLLEELHSELVSRERLGSEILQHTGGLIPVGGMNELVGDLGGASIFLAGDAAGLTNPVTGAGINAAVISGRLAGEGAVAVLQNKPDAHEDYCEEISDLFEASIDRAVERRRALMEKFTTTEKPTSNDLRSGWIAYPQYWRSNAPQMPIQ